MTQYRMYGLVPYNISPIQQAIQYGHAVVEYALKFFDEPNFQQWANHDKTFIILNGGTTNRDNLGTLNIHEMTLQEKDIEHACFYEPDLGDQLTAVVFLVDERVWDKEMWPDYSGDWITDFSGTKPDETPYREWKNKFSTDEKEQERVLWLREFLKNFRLA